MFSSDCASVCVSARMEPVNQTVGALNSNSSKIVKDTDIEFVAHVSPDIPFNIP